MQALSADISDDPTLKEMRLVATVAADSVATTATTTTKAKGAAAEGATKEAKPKTDSAPKESKVVVSAS